MAQRMVLGDLNRDYEGDLHDVKPDENQISESSALMSVRFPCMSAAEIEWEVIPSGLLGYEDVRHLLHFKAGKTLMPSRFNACPREHPDVAASREADQALLLRSA